MGKSINIQSSFYIVIIYNYQLFFNRYQSINILKCTVKVSQLDNLNMCINISAKNELGSEDYVILPSWIELFVHTLQLEKIEKNSLQYFCSKNGLYLLCKHR
jgi:hypothetical protein